MIKTEKNTDKVSIEQSLFVPESRLSKKLTQVILTSTNHFTKINLPA
jgi:hypothetical protein